MKTIKIKCKTCDKEFEKYVGEYNRKIKNGDKNFFCSQSCSSKRKENIEHIKNNKSNYDISKHSGNRQDQYSDFKYYMKLLKNSKRKENVNIDLEYLKFLWEQQNGICPISGIKMILKEHNSKNSILPNQASLDRIDSSKPYEIGNVRFITLIANYARNVFSDEDVIQFCVNVAKFKSQNNKL